MDALMMRDLNRARSSACEAMCGLIPDTLRNGTYGKLARAQCGGITVGFEREDDPGNVIALAIEAFRAIENAAESLKGLKGE